MPFWLVVFSLSFSFAIKGTHDIHTASKAYVKTCAILSKWVRHFTVLISAITARRKEISENGNDRICQIWQQNARDVLELVRQFRQFHTEDDAETFNDFSLSSRSILSTFYGLTTFAWLLSNFILCLPLSCCIYICQMTVAECTEKISISQLENLIITLEKSEQAERKRSANFIYNFGNVFTHSNRRERVYISS